MRAERKLLLLILFGGLLLVPTPWLALQESTEARYGEIAREMLVSGNFLEPTLNGIAHFHKPPLAYWGMAAGMKLFGVNGFGVRFFGVVAALCALYWLYRTAQLLLADDRKAFTALLVLASSFLFLVVSRTVATDSYLTCFVLGAQYQLFRQIYGQRNRWNVCRYALLLGLGFLTKGPLIFLFTVVPSLIAGLFDKRHRRVWGIRDGLLGSGVFLLVALPWYLTVIHEHANLLAYFLKTQTVDRVATDRFNRSKPFWFYFVLFPATLFPAIVPFLRSMVSSRCRWPGRGALYCYVAVPFLVFSLSRSKMGPYLLPLYGVAVIIAVRTYYDCKAKLDHQVALAACLLLPLLIAVSGLVYKPLGPGVPYLLLLALATIIAGVFLRRMVHTDRFLAGVSLLLVGVNAVCYLFVPTLETAMKGYRQLTASITARDPGRQRDVIVYRDFLPSISFYRGKLAIMAMGKERELNFQRDTDYRRWYVSSEDELRQRVANLPTVFVVARPAHIGQFQKTAAMVCTELFAQRKHRAYECVATPGGT